MDDLGLELKFAGGAPVLTDEAGTAVIEGYASLFGLSDQGGDIVLPNDKTQVITVAQNPALKKIAFVKLSPIEKAFAN